MTTKKTRKPKRSNSKKDISTARAFFYVASFFIFLIVSVFVLHYKQGLQLYICTNYGKFCDEIIQSDPVSDGAILNPLCKSITRHKVSAYNIRNLELIKEHETNHIFGIDISEYQGDVNWNDIYCTEDAAKIDFIISRATAGIDKVDDKFKVNWKNSRKKGFIRGAYHYYRPDEDPTEQALNFIETVTLYPSDLPPILDIEKKPKKISKEQFITNLNIWLKIIKKHYKIQPIIYSGQSFHEDYLQEHFPDYLTWIANYNFFTETMQPNWHIWQFTEKGYVNGIKGNVDVNIFRGNIEDLKELTIK